MIWTGRTWSKNGSRKWYPLGLSLLVWASNYRHCMTMKPNADDHHCFPAFWTTNSGYPMSWPTATIGTTQKIRLPNVYRNQSRPPREINKCLQKLSGHGYLKNWLQPDSQMEVFGNRGTPSHHPHYYRIFPSEPSILWKPPYSFHPLASWAGLPITTTWRRKKRCPPLLQIYPNIRLYQPWNSFNPRFYVWHLHLLIIYHRLSWWNPVVCWNVHHHVWCLHENPYLAFSANWLYIYPIPSTWIDHHSPFSSMAIWCVCVCAPFSDGPNYVASLQHVSIPILSPFWRPQRHNDWCAPTVQPVSALGAPTDVGSSLVKVLAPSRLKAESLMSHTSTNQTDPLAGTPGTPLSLDGFC